MAALRLKSLAFKAGFRPGQERHPKGSGRVSGRWRREATRKPLDVDIPGPRKTPAADGSPKTPPKSPRLKLPKPGIGHNGGPPLEDPPELPKRDPGTSKGRTAVAKRMARWLLTALSRAPDPRIRLVAQAIQAVGWLTGAFDSIETYLDEPKSLDKLRRAVKAEKGRKGTDVHHIVEKESAYQDGFTTRQIEGPDNLVRIPRYKHHEINGWYQRQNPDFDWQSPRDHLRGRSWEERVKIGIEQLVDKGVLKP
ncbi:hypothetical protein VSX64_00615 [Aurantimonas sp. C2-6-R+9]|uniref:hypothetical protein n=1 Tax=unclassified Aurantimonas TaxID=2638230 RepID=UPI002E18227C|nr:MULTISPECIES: hypothetical protein [unclassified Aurantimonas]MEC5289031.1 hypothetical protein [Aurantimonas sp. C2-3-R2]MEC5379394.1 hypothetical protein [Aurantimonas sp. C2-6-R+9]MEC5410147.1 hypothetical protein [Aurantimonas sp. C2-4-R8]